MASILIIGPQATLCSEGIRSVLQDKGHQVVFFLLKVDVGFSQLREYLPEIVIVDLASNTAVQEDFARWLCSMDPRPRLIGGLYAARHGSLLSWPTLPMDGLLFAGNVSSLLECVSAVARGERWVDPDLLLDLSNNDQFASLSPRELEVVNWISQGLRNKEIARKLSVSEGTIKMHLHHIFSKLRVQGRAQIAHCCRSALPAPAPAHQRPYFTRRPEGNGQVVLHRASQGSR